MGLAASASSLSAAALTSCSSGSAFPVALSSSFDLNVGIERLDDASRDVSQRFASIHLRQKSFVLVRQLIAEPCQARSDGAEDVLIAAAESYASRAAFPARQFSSFPVASVDSSPLGRAQWHQR